jgi:DNA-binding Lrp family transcriptional regulator
MAKNPELTDLEMQVILALQRDLEITPRPFRELAVQLGLSEEKFLAVVQDLVAKGFIRRFGATLRHQLSGYKANALVVWRVPSTELKRLGEFFARHRSVTHCYHREPASHWPYNLYTMIHGKDPEEIKAIVTALAQAAGLQEYEILFSDTELKKTTMRYFKEEG